MPDLTLLSLSGLLSSPSDIPQMKIREKNHSSGFWFIYLLWDICLPERLQVYQQWPRTLGKCRRSEFSPSTSLDPTGFYPRASVQLLGTKFRIPGDGAATFRGHFSICVFLTVLSISWLWPLPLSFKLSFHPACTAGSPIFCFSALKNLTLRWPRA